MVKYIPTKWKERRCRPRTGGAWLRPIFGASPASLASSKVQGELNAAILTARASGETYRDIGKAAGLSHVTIRQIVTESDDG